MNKAGIVLHAGMTATVDMVLGVSKIEKEVKVVAEALLIDITDASLSKTYVTQEMLQNLPTSQDTLELLNLAPGIVDLSAYGGGDLTGNSTQIDGVDVTDARFGGGNFTMNIDYNVIEESQVMGLGAPAEYGNAAEPSSTLSPSQAAIDSAAMPKSTTPQRTGRIKTSIPPNLGGASFPRLP